MSYVGVIILFMGAKLGNILEESRKCEGVRKKWFSEMRGLVRKL